MGEFVLRCICNWCSEISVGFFELENAKAKSLSDGIKE